MENREVLIKIAPDGHASFFLHHDDNPLFDQAEATIIRASNVRFDNTEKLWFVWERQPDGSEVILPKGHIRRADAIAYEIEMLNQKLRDEPGYVEQRFESITTGSE